MDRIRLREIYKRYGFEEQSSNIDGVCVFTLRAGHYHNADIVPLTENANEEKVFSDFKSTGYACKVRKYSSLREVEETLFKGFFNVDSTKRRLKKEYESFSSSVVSSHSDTAKYSYIKSGYFINSKAGTTDVVTEILGRIGENKPILFLIEAAAGFGKTCTAYELLDSFVKNGSTRIPLFSELSRNRQAKIFRYVLLDEIDRSFPLLSSQLVRTEIKNGNVPVILDGFDELLHSSSDSDGYDNTEPMLETIGDLLHGNAKVVLTTRRTAIFDGDEFHEWMDLHEDDFEIIRIRIDEPTVVEWLTPDRYEQLVQNNFPIDKLSNPVLLSYLRCIEQEDFNNVVVNPDLIVDKYFTSMFERERIRQDLRIKPKDQYDILESVASDMIELNYTSESRDYILSVLEDKHLSFLENVRKEYPTDSRPTLDELVNKLASHAMFDRASDSSQGIGFVNEFVLGTFCADVILDESLGEWAGDSRFIEPTVLAYIPRSSIRSCSLWYALKFCLEFTNASQKLESSIMLTGSVEYDIEDSSIENIKISKVGFGNTFKVNNCIFIGCRFSNVAFSKANLTNTTFVNCEFYDCSISEEQSEIENHIQVLGSSSDSDCFIQNLSAGMMDSDLSGEQDFTGAEVYILEKYWPVGRDTFTKHRPIKGLCALNNSYSHHEVVAAIDILRRKGILLTPDKNSFLELNIEKISEVKLALGRS
ncbi:MAG: pentapeptide repeat-containing protein [Neptuniibacter sp.]